MKKHFALLPLVLLCTTPLLAQWDAGLGFGFNNFVSPTQVTDARYRLSDAGMAYVPSVFVTYQSAEDRWYGAEVYLVERVLNYFDQTAAQEIGRQENYAGLRLLFGKSLPVSRHARFETATGLHADWIFHRVYYVRNDTLPAYLVPLDGLAYVRFGAFVETGFKWEGGIFNGAWFFRLDADILATKRESFDRSRYIGFTTGLRVPVVSIRKKDLSDE